MFDLLGLSGDENVNSFRGIHQQMDGGCDTILQVECSCNILKPDDLEAARILEQSLEVCHMGNYPGVGSADNITLSDVAFRFLVSKRVGLFFVFKLSHRFQKNLIHSTHQNVHRQVLGLHGLPT